MYWFRVVIVPDDALVYEENDKVKADKIILSERKQIAEFRFSSIKLAMSQLDQNGLVLQFIPKQTLEMCLAAVRQTVPAHAA